MDTLLQQIRDKQVSFKEQSEMQRLDKELHDFAVKEIPEYKKLTTSEREVVRETLRFAKEYGASKADQILFGRISAKSGLAIHLTDKVPGGRDGRSALGVDNYTQKEYNNYGWARESGVLTAKENERLRSMFAQAVSGQAKPPKTQSGEYMIAVGEKVDNKIVYMKGTIDNPIITRIIEIDENNETKLDEFRRRTYATERGGVQRKAGGIFTLYTATDSRLGFNEQRNSLQGQRYNEQFGVNRRRGSQRTQKIKEILFNDDGNEISRKYGRNALDSSENVAFFDGKNTIYLDANAPRTRSYKGLLGHEVWHKMFKSF